MDVLICGCGMFCILSDVDFLMDKFELVCEVSMKDLWIYCNLCKIVFFEDVKIIMLMVWDGELNKEVM